MTDKSEKQIQIISGIVNARGCGGVQTPPQKDWTAQFTFQAWRDEAGLLHKEALRLLWNVSRQALRDYMARIQPYRIMQVKLILENDKAAELVEILDYECKTDKELNQIAIELQTPISFDHERFGIFVLDRRADWFSANTSWQGQSIRLILEAIEDEELQESLNVALQLWDNESQWNKKVLDYAVQHLLDIKNDYWLDEDENLLTADEFIACMRLESISISPEGDLNFWYKDGNLFAGHWIEVSGDLQSGLQSANIQG